MTAHPRPPSDFDFIKQRSPPFLLANRTERTQNGKSELVTVKHRQTDEQNTFFDILHIQVYQCVIYLALLHYRTYLFSAWVLNLLLGEAAVE